MAQEQEKPYLLDDEPATPWEIIAAAKAEGYSSDSGLMLTSEAAILLRSNGHTVKSRPARATT